MISNKNLEECDATGDYSSNGDGLKINIQEKLFDLDLFIDNKKGINF
jgi:hypothetical protein